MRELSKSLLSRLQFVVENQFLSLVDIPYLCRSSPRGGIGNSPRCLLPRAELSLLKDLNQYWEDVGINHILTREEILSGYTDTEQQP